MSTSKAEWSGRCEVSPNRGKHLMRIFSTRRSVLFGYLWVARTFKCDHCNYTYPTLHYSKVNRLDRETRK